MLSIMKVHDSVKLPQRESGVSTSSAALKILPYSGSHIDGPFSFQKSPCRYMAYMWTLTGLPYHDVEVEACTIAELGRTLWAF